MGAESEKGGALWLQAWQLQGSAWAWALRGASAARCGLIARCVGKRALRTPPHPLCRPPTRAREMHAYVRGAKKGGRMW